MVALLSVVPYVDPLRVLRHRDEAVPFRAQGTEKELHVPPDPPHFHDRYRMKENILGFNDPDKHVLNPPRIT